jgi:hypothetical protein
MKTQKNQPEKNKRPTPRKLTPDEVRGVAGGPIIDNGGGNHL